MWTHLEEKLENQDCFLKKSLELIGYFFQMKLFVYTFRRNKDRIEGAGMRLYNIVLAEFIYYKFSRTFIFIGDEVLQEISN